MSCERKREQQREFGGRGVGGGGGMRVVCGDTGGGASRLRRAAFVAFFRGCTLFIAGMGFIYCGDVFYLLRIAFIVTCDCDGPIVVFVMGFYLLRIVFIVTCDCDGPIVHVFVMG